MYCTYSKKFSKPKILPNFMNLYQTRSYWPQLQNIKGTHHFLKIVSAKYLNEMIFKNFGPRSFSLYGTSQPACVKDGQTVLCRDINGEKVRYQGFFQDFVRVLRSYIRGGKVLRSCTSMVWKEEQTMAEVGKCPLALWAVHALFAWL